MHRMRGHLLNAVFILACVSAPVALAQDRPSGVLFENVRIFNGTAGRLSAPSNVLVVGNVIRTISSGPIADPAGVDLRRIRGGGRTLMPGLIDNHWHTMLARPLPSQAIDGDVGYLNLLGGAEAQATLMRGFTTVRDLGGPSFGLKRAIDEGLVAGPRIYPSGAMITITGGHGDFRSPSELPRRLGGPLARMEVMGGSMVADSPDEVRVRVREQLLLGASQIKLTAGGGVASPHSPLDVSTFNEDELRAAVQAAENWGTYVGVHAYTPAAMRRAVAAGVKVIEHGHLMDEPTAELIAKKGIWLSFQPFTDDAAAAFLAPANRLRLQQVIAGTERTVALAKKYKIKMAFGTDILFSADRGEPTGGGARQDAQVVHRTGAPGDGYRHQCRAAQVVGPARSVPGPAGRRGRRCAGGSAAGGRRPPGEPQADRGSGEKLRGDHEGRQDLQERPAVRDRASTSR